MHRLRSSTWSARRLRPRSLRAAACQRRSNEDVGCRKRQRADDDDTADRSKKRAIGQGTRPDKTSCCSGTTCKCASYPDVDSREKQSINSETRDYGVHAYDASKPRMGVVVLDTHTLRTTRTLLRDSTVRIDPAHITIVERCRVTYDNLCVEVAADPALAGVRVVHDDVFNYLRQRVEQAERRRVAGSKWDIERGLDLDLMCQSLSDAQLDLLARWHRLFGADEYHFLVVTITGRGRRRRTLDVRERAMRTVLDDDNFGLFVALKYRQTGADKRFQPMCAHFWATQPPAEPTRLKYTNGALQRGA